MIDGTDGSGKATQTDLLVKRMRDEELSVETISFPQYGKKSAGPLEEYLEGRYGSADQVDAYQTSVLFAVDRFDVKKQINEWLDAGTHVIADRYVGSNMGHQGSKITDPTERKEYFTWNHEFEHDLMGLPEPDINLVLHVPTAVTQNLMKDRDLKSNLSKDVHESNAAHLHAAEQAYLDLTEQFDNYQLIKCVENDTLMTREAIHNRVWEYVKTLLNQK